MNAGKLIFVTGITGKQGGAVARHLLSHGFNVRGITRDPDKKEVAALVELGAEIREGDLNDKDSYKPFLRGAHGVFSVQNFWEAGYLDEIKQGQDLADCAKDAGVKHFVYSSVGSADKRTGLNHFDSKFEIEQHIKEIDLPYTIIRPVFFMENFYDMRDHILEGSLVFGMLPERPLHMIAVDDLGQVVAKVFEEPYKFINKEIDIAGDAVTFPQAADILSEVIEKDVQYMPLEMEEFRDNFGEEFGNTVDWFNRVGYNVDVEQLIDDYDFVFTSFEDWARTSEFARVGTKA
ncbi:MAG TPA: NmrA/HSCARG family protein [Ignavibacteriales bacterium]|nr:NmrA/HSCARG family protein [Ignavibacteriales bacterium]